MNTLRFTHITTIDVGDNFYIDIELDNKKRVYDLWIWEADTGIKEYMFGEPVEMDLFGERYINSVEEVTANAIRNAREHKRDYIKDHLEEER